MSSNLRDEVTKLASSLPKDASWDDLMYEIYVRQKIIDEGLTAASEGRVFSHEEIKRRFATTP